MLEHKVSCYSSDSSQSFMLTSCQMCSFTLSSRRINPCSLQWGVTGDTHCWSVDRTLLDNFNETFRKNRNPHWRDTTSAIWGNTSSSSLASLRCGCTNGIPIPPILAAAYYCPPYLLSLWYWKITWYLACSRWPTTTLPYRGPCLFQGIVSWQMDWAWRTDSIDPRSSDPTPLPFGFLRFVKDELYSPLTPTAIREL